MDQSGTITVYVQNIQKTAKKIQPITSELTTLSTNYMRAIRVACDPETGFEDIFEQLCKALPRPSRQYR